MAIDNYQATTNPGGSDSGWDCRFVTHFQDATAHHYRVEIIDSKLSGTSFTWDRDAPESFVCGSDGFTLTHEGSPDDLHQSIVTSSLSMDFLVTNANQELLFDELTSTTDHRFGIVVYRFTAGSGSSSPSNPIGHWRMIWCGVINPEGISLELGASSKFIRLEAFDGLAMLNEIPFVDDSGDAFDDWANFKTIIHRCIQHIPTSSLWGYDNGSSAIVETASTASTLSSFQPPFFIESIYQWDSVAHDIGALEGYTSVISNTGCQTQSFYSVNRTEDRFGGKIIDRDTISCAEVLNHLAQVLRARIYFADGSFHFQNPGTFDAETLNIRAIRWPVLSRLTSAAADTLGASVVHKVDVNSQGFDVVNGADDSFLHPIKTAFSIHQLGGTQSLFAPIGSNMGGQFYKNLYNNESTFHAANTWSNPDAILLEDDTPSLNGLVHTTLDDYGSDGSSNGTLHAGAKAVLEVQIKVGDYYLKGDIQHSSTIVNIHRLAASDLDFKGIERDGDVEWTLTESSYFIPIPNTLCDPFPAIAVDSSGNEHIGGANITLNGNNTDEFKYASGFMGSDGTNHNETSFELGWTLPALPSGTHTGVTLKTALQVYKHDGTQITDADDLTDLSNSTTGTIIKFQNLRLLSGTDGSQIDVSYTADQANNSAALVASSSILGNQINNAWLGILSVQDADDLGNYWASGEVWSSMSNTSAVMNIHSLNAMECLQERSRSLRTRRCTLAFGRQNKGTEYDLTDIKTIPSFNNTFRFDDETGLPHFIPTSLQWTASPSTIDFTGWITNIENTLTPDLDDTKGDRPPSFPPNQPSESFDKNPQGYSGGGIQGYQIKTIQNDVASNTATTDLIGTNAYGITKFTKASGTSSIDIVLPDTKAAAGSELVTIDTFGGMHPLADGSSGEFLKTNGSGSLSWAAAGGGGGGGGWHGSTALIKVMPSQFVQNDDAPQYPPVIEDDLSSNRRGVKIGAATSELYAFIPIPSQYKVTHGKVFTSKAGTNAVNIAEYDHETGTATSGTTGNFNTTIDCTDITSGTTSSVIIKLSPGTDKTIIFGANLTIAAV